MAKAINRKVVLLVLALGSILCFSVFSNSEVELNNDVRLHIPKSCTIFTATIGEKVYYGNNEDYLYDGTYLWFIPSQERATSAGYKQINGAVFFGFDSNNAPDVDGIPQGGMNDQGLCFDGNGLPPTLINYSSELIHPYAYYPFYEILWDCSTVNETIEWFSTHYFVTYMEFQLHFADASGDAVVISVDADGNFVFTRIGDSSYLVSTNFNLANFENGDYPCSRYDTACSMLGEITTEDNLTIDACRDVLDAVHSEGSYRTRYSNIFDLANQEIYIYLDRNFGKFAKINLADELGKIHPFDDGVEIAHGVFFKSIKMSDLIFESTSSVSTYSIVLIGTIGGITITSARRFVKVKMKSRKIQ